MKEYIDARNLPNPQPLVYTKRALAGGEFSHLIVHVNNEDARESVVKFARHAGFPVKKVDSKGDEYYITIAHTEGQKPDMDDSTPDILAHAGSSGTALAGERPDTLLVLTTEREGDLGEKIFAAIPSSSEVPSHLLLSGTILGRIAEVEELRAIAADLTDSGIRLLCEESESVELDIDSILPVPADEIVGLLLRAGKVVSF